MLLFVNSCENRPSKIPDEVHCTPCESRTESRKNDLVTLLQTTFVLVETQRYRSGARVTGMFDIDKHFFRGNAGARRNSLDNAQISLMWHQPVDIFD